MPESEISDTHACIPGDELLTVTAWHSLTNKVKGFHFGWDLGGGRGRESRIKGIQEETVRLYQRSREEGFDCLRAVLSCSVVSDSLWSHGLEPTRLLCPGNSPGKNTGVGSHSLLQGISKARNELRSPALQADSLPSESLCCSMLNLGFVSPDHYLCQYFKGG